LSQAGLWRGQRPVYIRHRQGVGSLVHVSLGEITISSRDVIFALWFAWGVYWADVAIVRRRAARRQRAGS